MTRLSLLSGGEKALTAIAFLFAVFLARPSPFYLLDEVEAALDDTNIGRFVELLRRFSDRAQFVVITHQKRTMEAADTLYGVTMGDDGVSQVVSRRTPRDDRSAASRRRAPEANLPRLMARTWAELLGDAEDAAGGGGGAHGLHLAPARLARHEPPRADRAAGARGLRPGGRRGLGAAGGGADRRRRGRAGHGRARAAAGGARATWATLGEALVEEAAALLERDGGAGLAVHDAAQRDPRRRA